MVDSSPAQKNSNKVDRVTQPVGQKAAISVEDLWAENMPGRLKELECLLNKAAHKDSFLFLRYESKLDSLISRLRDELEADENWLKYYPCIYEIRYKGQIITLDPNLDGVSYIVDLIQRPYQSIPANVLYSKNLISWDSGNYAESNFINPFEEDSIATGECEVGSATFLSKSWDKTCRQVPFTPDEIINDPELLDEKSDHKENADAKARILKEISRLRLKPKTDRNLAKIRELENYMAATYSPRNKLKADNALDRHRVNVKKALDRAINDISAEHALLAEHLRAFIKTGAFCSYEPDKDNPPNWLIILDSNDGY